MTPPQRRRREARLISTQTFYQPGTWRLAPSVRQSRINGRATPIRKASDDRGAVPSNLVSNVPTGLMMKPFVEPLTNQDTAWLTIAMTSTLAGHFTVRGSIVNPIVVQKAAAHGVQISIWHYFLSASR